MFLWVSHYYKMLSFSLIWYKIWVKTARKFDPTITLLGMYSREMKARVHTKTCMWLYIAVLWWLEKGKTTQLFISKIDWISKMWYSHTMEYHSGRNRNEVPLSATTGMSLENMILNQRSNHYRPHLLNPIYVTCLGKANL